MPSSHEFPPLPPVDHLVWGGPSLEQAIDRLEVRNGRRQQSNGQVLSWQFTYPDLRAGDGLVPFLIDRDQRSHPAHDAPGGVQLVDLGAEHPHPAAISRLLRHLDIDLRMSRGPRRAPVATLDTPHGRVELR